jgi:uncharacterized protein (DUF983 family)
MYQRWMKLHERCGVCDLQYLPNQGDLWGPLLFFDRILFIIPVIVLVYFGMWDPNRRFVTIFALLAIVILVATLPNRNGMSLALDYLIRRKSGDLYEPDPEEDAE